MKVKQMLENQFRLVVCVMRTMYNPNQLKGRVIHARNKFYSVLMSCYVQQDHTYN
jgi:hypothetical protein